MTAAGRGLAIAFAAAASLAALAACAGLPTAPLAPTCLPLKTYTPQQQQALAAALEALPDNSPLAGAMADYAVLRAADRACLSAKP